MRSLLALLILGTAGCASGIRVAYPRPDTPEVRRLTQALGNLYIILRKPEAFPQTVAAKAVLRAHDGPGTRSFKAFDINTAHFAERLAAALKARGAHILAYRVERRDTSDADPFKARLQPAGILTVDFEHLETDITKGSSETWKFEARLTFLGTLTEHPDGKLLRQFRHTIRYTDSAHIPRMKPDQKDPVAADWYVRRQEAILTRGAREVPDLLGRIPIVSHKRALHTDKDDPRSAAAAKAAAKDEWERASELWAQRLEAGAGDWRDLMNLAVAAEKRREFPEADRIYRKARESAGADPEAGKIPWDELLTELAGALDAVGRRSQAAVAWFEAPTAVMPFSDETTSVDGPEFLREMVVNTLRRGGYNVLDLIAVDRGLREHGISQGGQLKGSRRTDYAGWLGAERLFFGHISDFEHILLGVYGKRLVRGKLSLWERGTGVFLWDAEEPALREDATTDAGEASARFGRQVFKGLFERIISRPLGFESALFIRQNLETLPLKLGH